MNLFILLPILLILSFTVVISNQLLQAIGVRSSSKFWTDLKSKFLISYGHNDLAQKYITKPLVGLLGKPDTSSNGFTRGLNDSSNSKVNVLDKQHIRSNI
jgi:hypothetical protein